MKQLIDLGIDCSEANGWLHNKGLQVVGGGVTLELEWPMLANFPNFGSAASTPWPRCASRGIGCGWSSRGTDRGGPPWNDAPPGCR
jgi:hypothetical protein